ncbi:MAG: hypothetical protein U9N46_01470 [Euryarchaeota archaeon]|nr:hypothetical protein [Euryarchaeota archaeon]
MHDIALRDANSGYWILIERTSERVARVRRGCWSGAIQALVAGTTVVNGTLEPIREVAGAKAVFYGISIAGVAELLGLERFCPRSM